MHQQVNNYEIFKTKLHLIKVSVSSTELQLAISDFKFYKTTKQIDSFASYTYLF